MFRPQVSIVANDLVCSHLRYPSRWPTTHRVVVSTQVRCESVVVGDKVGTWVVFDVKWVRVWALLVDPGKAVKDACCRVIQTLPIAVSAHPLREVRRAQDQCV
jgi:hypothetical protein